MAKWLNSCIWFIKLTNESALSIASWRLGSQIQSLVQKYPIHHAITRCTTVRNLLMFECYEITTSPNTDYTIHTVKLTKRSVSKLGWDSIACLDDFDNTFHTAYPFFTAATKISIKRNPTLWIRHQLPVSSTLTSTLAASVWVHCNDRLSHDPKRNPLLKRLTKSGLNLEPTRKQRGIKSKLTHNQSWSEY